ncbi:MAG: hypothetical protein ACOZQL_39720 [Myxococcota bacterium]
MFLSAYLALLCSQFPPPSEQAGSNPLTRMRLEANPQGLTFDWQDEEDVLRGTLTPHPLRVGAPLTVSLSVEPLQGAPYEGPVTIALRPLDDVGATQTQTVTKKKGEKTWSTTFVLDSTVDHRLEVSWRSTRHKVVLGVVQVREAALPGWLSWVVGGGLVAIALAIGLWVLFGRGKESAP